MTKRLIYTRLGTPQGGKIYQYTHTHAYHVSSGSNPAHSKDNNNSNTNSSASFVARRMTSMTIAMKWWGLVLGYWRDLSTNWRDSVMRRFGFEKIILSAQ